MEYIIRNCPNCGATIDIDSNQESMRCNYCNSIVYNKQALSENEGAPRHFNHAHYNAPVQPAKRPMSKLAMGILIALASVGVLFIVLMIVANVVDWDAIENNVVIEEIEYPARGPFARDVESRETHTLSPGEAFTFDDFEVIIGEAYEWRIVEHFSDQSPIHGLDAIRVPITVINLSEESRSFNNSNAIFRVYGPAGMCVSSSTVTTLFREDYNIFEAPSVRSGVTISDRYIHFLYDGDGYYHITFSMWNEAWEVEMFIER